MRRLRLRLRLFNAFTRQAFTRAAFARETDDAQPSPGIFKTDSPSLKYRALVLLSRKVIF
jgi:hypothetical protein